MAKLTYNPTPTFEHTVKITTPDGKQGDLPFVFIHKKMSELDEMGKADDLTDTDFLLQIAKGWGLKIASLTTIMWQNFSIITRGQLSKFSLPIAKRS